MIDSMPGDKNFAQRKLLSNERFILVQNIKNCSSSCQFVRSGMSLKVELVSKEDAIISAGDAN